MNKDCVFDTLMPFVVNLETCEPMQFHTAMLYIGVVVSALLVIKGIRGK